VKRINNCCPSYVTKARHIASWQKRPPTVQNQNNKHAIANDLKTKSSCLHGQNNTLVCIGTAFTFLPNVIRVKNQFKEDSKTSKTTKAATKENKNDVANGHEKYMDTKCTAHGSAMVSFVFASAAGRPNRCRKIHGEPSHVTWLTSAVELRSTNAIRLHIYWTWAVDLKIQGQG